MIMKRLMILLLVAAMFFSMLSCAKQEETQFEKYSEGFFGTFDTLTQVVGYAKSEEEFHSYVEKLRVQLEELHKLYDKYNEYEGINNIKTINDNAGIRPVKVDKRIIDLINFSKEWYAKTGGKTNISMGAVLEIWHDYREAGKADPEGAMLPPMELLLDAAQHTDINKVIVDEANSTVFLEDKDMRLDVGAIAKGYATELAVKVLKEDGFTSGIISPGGNIRVLDKPLDGVRERWGVGIQNPDAAIVSDDQSNLLDTIFINNSAVVSSGDYQRYYIVDGKVIHHLIDPQTLMPGEHYKAVTVLAKDSGIADFLSTTAFLLPYEESKALIESLDGIEAVWVMPDGSIKATEGMRKIMKSQGATGAK